MLFSAKSYEKILLDSISNEIIQFSYCFDSLNHDTAKLIKNTDAISIFVNDKVDASMAETLAKSGIKFIITRSTGMDHIDLESCKLRNINVANIPNYGSESIAEHALMLTLCLMRKYKQTQINMTGGDYRLDELMGDSIHKKTVGVIGTGKIGSHYAKIMHSMGAHVLGYDASPDLNLEISNTLRYTNLIEIFFEADIISLHLPLTPETHYFFSQSNLIQLRKFPWIINSARGGLVDTRAMIDAIKNKKIKGYAADVYEHEGDIFFKKHESKLLSDSLFNELIELPNVIITPHQAFAENNSIQIMLKKMIKTIERWAEPKNVKIIPSRI